MSLNKIKSEINSLANPKKAASLQKYFKTGKGEYGEGDIFLGLTVPISRKIALNYPNLSLNEIKDLLKSKIHEHRLIALFILVDKFKKSKEKKEIFDFYLDNAGFINNWDLVDSSAEQIVGEYLIDKDKSILYYLSSSSNIWERRISIISTFHFIKNNQFIDTLKISEILFKDKHDLIHKAVGWMLREVGKKDSSVLEKFLKSHYKFMPRTSLRYAIERFPEEKRQRYLKGEI